MQPIPQTSNRSFFYSPWRWYYLLAIAFLIIKLMIAWNTRGTNDVITFNYYAQAVSEYGIDQTYQTRFGGFLFNHPPLIGGYLYGIYSLAGKDVQVFAFLLRLPGILADLGTALLFLYILRRIYKQTKPTLAHYLLVASPLSLMISGFHGNTDPILAFFLFAGTLAVYFRHVFFAAILFTFAINIKVAALPVIVISALFFPEWKKRILFGMLTGTLTLLTWLDPLLYYPQDFLQNLFGYSGTWGMWGITSLLRYTGIEAFQEIHFSTIQPPATTIMSALKACAVFSACGIAFWIQRIRPQAIFLAIACGWLIMFTLSPSMAPQYLVWPLAFFALAIPGVFIGYTLVASILLFFWYHCQADAFPWYYVEAKELKDFNSVPWSYFLWGFLLIATLMVLKSLFSPSFQQFSKPSLSPKSQDIPTT